MSDKPRDGKELLEMMQAQAERNWRDALENWGVEFSPDATRDEIRELYNAEFLKRKEESEERDRQLADSWQQAEKQEQFRGFLKSIPPRYRNASVNDLKMSVTTQSLLNGASGVILGSNGNGKTHLEWALGRAWAEKGESVKIVKAQEFLHTIKFKDDPYEYMKRNLRGKVKHLIIDEIDKIFESKADFVYLNYLVDMRYEWMLQTVVVGNGTIQAFIASLGQSIFARLSGEGGVGVEMGGKDWRDVK